MDETWKSDLGAWLAPFVSALRHKTRARMCPAYIAGLIGAGDRKSVQPMAARVGEVGYDQLHHFIASGVWDIAPLEKALLAEADRMVGADDALLIVDDTALPKKGAHSVGVAPQYASSLGKTANCQSMVSLTLASREVPVMVGLRLFLPESWTGDPERMARAAYQAALVVLDAKVLFSPMKVSAAIDPAVTGTKATVEEHHLFPKAHLAGLEITERKQVNQIANFALLEWPDNLKVGATAPDE